MTELDKNVVKNLLLSLGEEGKETLEILNGLEDSDQLPKENVIEALRLMGEKIPIALMLHTVLTSLSPSQDMDPTSATYGFILAIEIAIHHPEWAMAFNKKHLKDHPETDPEVSTETSRTFLTFMPLKMTIEPQKIL